MQSTSAFLLAIFVLALAALATADRAKWMLSKEDIAISRQGKIRNGLQAFSSGNDITMHADGQKFMKSLYYDIEETSKGDFVHGVMFDETAEVVLNPSLKNEAENEKSTIAHTLVRAIKRGVHVRILANLNAYLPLNAIIFCRHLNKHCKNCCLPDQRHGSASGSVHNKMWVISRKGRGAVGYVGGMDVAAGRYDTRGHENDATRDKEPGMLQKFYGWHDVMYRIRGKAVKDLAAHFAQRWNDEATPAPTYCTTPFKYVEPIVDDLPGSLSIQFLRTLSCQAAVTNKYYKRFAPMGEFSFQFAFKKMLANARKYVFLADQFVYYPEALQWVADALPRIQKLVIMTDSPHSWTIQAPAIKLEFATNTRQYYQYQALKALKDSGHGSKVHVYELVKPGGQNNKAEDLIYLHSKNYFADDEYAIIGSAGIERAAFNNDIEVCLGVYDDSGKGPDSFVGKIRRDLWAEHLGTTPDDPAIRDPVEAVKLFEKQADNPEWRLRRYWPDPVEKGWYMDYIYNFYEADGTCTAEQLGAQQMELAVASGEVVHVSHQYIYWGIPAALVVTLAVGVATGFVVSTWLKRDFPSNKNANPAVAIGYTTMPSTGDF